MGIYQKSDSTYPHQTQHSVVTFSWLSPDAPTPLPVTFITCHESTTNTNMRKALQRKSISSTDCLKTHSPSVVMGTFQSMALVPTYFYWWILTKFYHHRSIETPNSDPLVQWFHYSRHQWGRPDCLDWWGGVLLSEAHVGWRSLLCT